MTPLPPTNEQTLREILDSYLVQTLEFHPAEDIPALEAAIRAHYRSLLHRQLDELKDMVNEQSYPHIDHDVFEDRLAYIISGGALAYPKEVRIAAETIVSELNQRITTMQKRIGEDDNA